MASLAALILVPISTICSIGICLISIIILSYIKHKPEVNQSTFDIAALHMGWAHICVGFFAYGAKYLGFFSSRSLITREKYISFAQLVLLSFYIF